MPLPFQGTAWALSSNGLAAVASSLAVFAPEIWTVLAVETSGCGYLPDRRPQILYERHVFHRLTGGRYDDGDISDSSRGGYGARGAHQYDRLNLAIANDREAALRSTSWGIGQIMGENYAAAGFAGVEDMVAAMLQSEDQQLAAMGNFLISTKLQPSLQAHDWTTFARGYNGPNYAINRYDARLNAEYQRFSSGLLPDLKVRAAHLYLTYLGFDPGPVDGIAGQHTISALAQFQTQAGLATAGMIDADTVGQLQAALPPVGDAAGAPQGSTFTA
jgi:N-acetylmuramidase/Putative peptidoglycan binding domain